MTHYDRLAGENREMASVKNLHRSVQICRAAPGDFELILLCGFELIVSKTDDERPKSGVAGELGPETMTAPIFTGSRAFTGC